MRSGDWSAIVLDALVVPATLTGRHKLSRMLVLVYANENWRILILVMIYWLSSTPYPKNRVFSLQRDSTSHPHTCYSKISFADLIGSPEIETATKYRAMTDRGRSNCYPNRVTKSDRISGRKWIWTHLLPDRVRENDAERRFDMERGIGLESQSLVKSHPLDYYV